MAWPKAMPIVEVVWIDSSHIQRWQSVEELERELDNDGLECRTTGYLFRDQEDRVTILQSQAECGNVADAMTVPRVAIKSMSVLKEAQS